MQLKPAELTTNDGMSTATIHPVQGNTTDREFDLRDEPLDKFTKKVSAEHNTTGINYHTLQNILGFLELFICKKRRVFGNPEGLARGNWGNLLNY